MRLAMIVAMGLLGPTAAMAGAFETGDELYGWCSTPDRIALCQAYILGVADSLANGDSVAGFRACFGHDADVNHLQDTVVEFLYRHADQRHYGAASLVAAALADKYACNL